MASNQAQGGVLSMASIDHKPRTIFRSPVHTFLVIFFRRNITVFNQRLHTEIDTIYSYISYRSFYPLANVSSFHVCPGPLLKKRSLFSSQRSVGPCMSDDRPDRKTNTSYTSCFLLDHKFTLRKKRGLRLDSRDCFHRPNEVSRSQICKLTVRCAMSSALLSF